MKRTPENKDEYNAWQREYLKNLPEEKKAERKRRKEARWKERYYKDEEFRRRHIERNKSYFKNMRDNDPEKYQEYKRKQREYQKRKKMEKKSIDDWWCSLKVDDKIRIGNKLSERYIATHIQATKIWINLTDQQKKDIRDHCTEHHGIVQLELEGKSFSY